MIFIDTGPFLARHIERDQHHRTAVAAWRRLAGDGRRCATSNFVLDETFTLLGRRAGYAFAADRARGLLASPSLLILRPVPEDEVQAVELLEKFADQEVSFTDCISFVLMRRHRIRCAFAFDRHFERAGFQVWPQA
ncbi:MAG: type II toxin-antitoxin system VapC family toxin [Thermodesulfobacteriota bacterium]